MEIKYSWTKIQAFKQPIVKEKYKELWKKIKQNSIRLDNICGVHRGLWTGALYVFIVPEDIIEEYNIERDALRPAIRGRDIRPFGYIWKGFYVIYASARHVPNFADKFPNTMAWLEKHRVILERRSAVFTWKKEWWELEDPLDPKIFELAKILSPLFARYPSFALDYDGKFYVLDSTVMIRKWLSEEELSEYAKNWNKINEPKINIEAFLEIFNDFWKRFKSTEQGLWYILGLLNSEVLEFFFKQYSPRLSKRTRRPKKGRWFSYMPPYINILPIRTPSSDIINKVINLSKEISVLTSKYLSLQENADKSYKNQLESEIGFLLKDLNETIFEIYNLTEKEIITLQNFVYKKR